MKLRISLLVDALNSCGIIDVSDGRQLGALHIKLINAKELIVFYADLFP